MSLFDVLDDESDSDKIQEESIIVLGGEEEYCYECRFCTKQSNYMPESKLDKTVPKGFVFHKEIGMVCKECFKQHKR